MRRMSKAILGAIVLAFLIGCATVPTMEKPVEKSRDFNKPFKEVWSSTIEGLTRSGELISFTEKESGLIVIEKDLGGNEISSLATNAPALTIWHRGKVKASIFIKPISETSTRVFANVNLSGIGVTFLQQYSQEFMLNSNGTIERNYLNLVDSLISSGRQYEAFEKDYVKNEGAKPSLGIAVKDLTPEVALAVDIPMGKGVLVTQVKKDSPAFKAEIKPGDVIILFNGNEVRSVKELSEVVKNMGIGKEVEVRIIRKGETKLMKIVMEQ